jgi:hypothetical protein
MINPEELDFRVYYNKMQLLLLNAGCMDLPTQKAIAYAIDCMETYGIKILGLTFDGNGKLISGDDGLLSDESLKSIWSEFKIDSSTRYKNNECAILSEKSLAKDWSKEDEDWREL